MSTREETREALAIYAHKAWSGWMKWLFKLSSLERGGAVVIPPSLANRWKRQVKTDYTNLSEEEKDSDRKEADKMLAIVNN